MSMLNIHVPGFGSGDPKKFPLVRAVNVAADRKGCRPETMADAITHFLEAVCDEVSNGEQVRIPGFGMFTAISKEVKGHPEKLKRAKIYFLPARQFGNYVARTCSKSKAQMNTEQFYHYLGSHNTGDPRKPRKDSSPQQSFADWRRILRSQTPDEVLLKFEE